MSEPNMRKLSTLKFPKIPERYEIIDAKARKSIEGLEQTTSTHSSNIKALQDTVSTHGTSIGNLVEGTNNLKEDVSQVQDHFSSEMKEVSGKVVQIESMAGNVLKPITTFEPKQEGSGDPYPAGGGKNLFYVEPQSLNGITVSLNADGTYVLNGTAASLTMIRTNCNYPEGTYTLSSQSLPDDVYVRARTADGALLGTNNSQSVLTHMFTGTPGICEFTVAAGVVLENAVIKPQLEKGTTATEWQPHSNIRPIIGYDALKLVATGKNLLPNNFEYFEAGGITAYKNPDGSIRVYGTCTTENIVTIGGDWGNVTENIIGVDDCYITLSPYFGTKILKANGTEDWYSGGTFYFAPGDKLLWAYIHFHPGEVWDRTVYPQVELGTEITAYEPFGTVHTVQIGETIYGGKLDWHTGVLTVDKAIVTLDGANQKATLMNANSNYVQVKLGDVLPDARKQAGNSNLICSHLPEQYGLFSDFPYPHVFLDVTDTPYIRAYFSTTLATTVNEVNTYLASQYAAGTPIQVVYKLATPKVIQLTPTQILALQGTNTLYGDGIISLSSKGDILEVIDRVTSMEQALFDTKEYEYNGSIIQFDAPLEGSPIEAVTAIAVKQAGSGDPSPSNIRLITGYDKLELNAAGKNLVEKIVYGYIAGGSTEPNFNVDNESVSAVVHVVKGQQYKISCAVPLNRLTVAKAETTEFAAQQKLTNAKDFPISGMEFVAEFTGIAVVYIKSTKDETVKDSLQIELGSTASPFTPYAGNTYTVQLGQIVYGGKFDWLTGKGRIDWSVKTVDGAESGWAKSSSGKFYSYEAYPRFQTTEAICSHYKKASSGDKTFAAYAGDTVYFTDSSFDTVDQWKAFLAAQYAAGTPVQFAWKLATPIEIQLTPQDLTTLRGINTIYSDAGETSISVRKDIFSLLSHLTKQNKELKATIEELQS